MAYFQAILNPRVILEFTTPWDIGGMREHPEYVEVSKEGVPVSKKPRSDQREDWKIPFTRVDPVRAKGAK